MGSDTSGGALRHGQGREQRPWQVSLTCARPLHRAAAAAPAPAVGLPTFALRRWRSACKRRAVLQRGARRSGERSRVAPAPPPGAPQGLHGEERACLNRVNRPQGCEIKLGAVVRNGPLMRSRAPAVLLHVYCCLASVVWHRRGCHCTFGASPEAPHWSPVVVLPPRQPLPHVGTLRWHQLIWHPAAADDGAKAAGVSGSAAGVLGAGAALT